MSASEVGDYESSSVEIQQRDSARTKTGSARGTSAHSLSDRSGICRMSLRRAVDNLPFLLLRDERILEPYPIKCRFRERACRQRRLSAFEGRNPNCATARHTIVTDGVNACLLIALMVLQSDLQRTLNEDEIS